MEPDRHATGPPDGGASSRAEAEPAAPAAAASSSVRSMDFEGRFRLLEGTMRVCLGGALLGVGWTLWNGFVMNPPSTVVLSIAFTMMLVVLRATRALDACLHAFAGMLWLGMVAIMVRTSGQTLSPFILLPICPILAALVLGRGAAVFWAGMCFVALGIGYAHMIDPALAPDHPSRLPEVTVARTKFFGSALMTIVVTGICVTAARLRHESIEALIESKQLADQRYRQVLAQHASLEQARMDEAVVRDRFFSHVSHELRTPLTPLHQFLTLLLDEVPGPVNAEQREFLDVALRNAQQIGRSISDLTEAARLQSGSLRIDRRVIRPEAIARRAWTAFEDQAAAKDLSVGFRMDPDALVCGDPDHLVRVLYSLLDNAVRFSPEGGTIEIRAEADPEDRAGVVFSIVDEGPGIDPEQQLKIFESLYRVEQGDWKTRQGLGLGLYIAQALVKRMDGRLWVESEKGSGTSFRFALPRYDLSALVAAVIDDESRLLDALGILVARVPDGVTGDPSRACRAIGEELAVVLYPHVDVLLPIDAPGVPSNVRMALVRTTATTLDAAVARVAGHFASREGPDEASAVVVDGRPVVFFHDRDRAASLARATRRVEEAIGQIAAGFASTGIDSPRA